MSDAGANEAAWQKSVAALSEPLDVRDYEVIRSNGRHCVLIKLSRLPDGVGHRTLRNPARIVLEIKGPTGPDTVEERFPGEDTLITSLWIGSSQDMLQIVLELQSDSPPEYSVHPMADWIMVRFSVPDA